MRKRVNKKVWFTEWIEGIGIVLIGERLGFLVQTTKSKGKGSDCKEVSVKGNQLQRGGR